VRQGKEKQGRKRKKETLEKKLTSYTQLRSVLMWEIIYQFVSKLFSLPSSTLFVILEVQGRSIISLSFIAEN